MRWLVKSLVGRFALDQRLLAGIAESLYTPLLPMHEIGQRVLVMHIGRRDYRAVRESGLTVHPDAQFHAKVPLLALAFAEAPSGPHKNRCSIADINWLQKSGAIQIPVTIVYSHQF